MQSNQGSKKDDIKQNLKQIDDLKHENSDLKKALEDLIDRM